MMNLELVEKTAQAADKHARTCPKCFHPIIDDEGNPGLFGEACPDGLVLLVAYCEASGSFVPAWAKKKVNA